MPHTLPTEPLDCERCRWADFDGGDDGASGATCWLGSTVKPMPDARCEHYTDWRTDPLEHTPIVRGYQPKPKGMLDV